MDTLSEITSVASLDYEIKPLTKEDLKFQEEMLYQSLYVPEDKEVYPREIVFNPLIHRYIKDWGRPGDFGFVAELKDTKKQVAAAWYRLFTSKEKGFGFISPEIPEVSVAVDYHYRHLGIGTRLLLSLSEQAENVGYSALSLSIIPENDAIHLYQRLGFEVVESAGPHFVMKLDLKDKLK
jgi:ribosomal protein S18 acetylase RimI-like enzyme